MITIEAATHLIVAVRQSDGGFRFGRHGRTIVVGRGVPRRLRAAVRGHHQAVGTTLKRLLHAPPPCPSIVLARVDEYIAAGRTPDTGWICALADLGFGIFQDLVGAWRMKLLETLDPRAAATDPEATLTRAVVEHQLLAEAIRAGWPMARLFAMVPADDPELWGFVQQGMALDPGRRVVEIQIARDGATVWLDDGTRERWACAVPAGAVPWWLAPKTESRAAP